MIRALDVAQYDLIVEEAKGRVAWPRILAKPPTIQGGRVGSGRGISCADRVGLAKSRRPSTFYGEIPKFLLAMVTPCPLRNK